MRLKRAKKLNREKLKDLSVQLLDIQIQMMKLRGLCEDEFEIEIAKYLRDCVSERMVDGEYSGCDIRKIHPYIVWKYPHVFQIFNETDSEMIGRKDIEWRWRMEENLKLFEKRNGDIQKKYDSWRKRAEKERRPFRYIDCAFMEARESFSQYCKLPQIIPFEIMFWCECNYSGDT